MRLAEERVQGLAIFRALLQDYQQLPHPGQVLAGLLEKQLPIFLV